MNIKILGAHRCESRNTRYSTLLIDDVLVLDGGGITSSLSLEAQQRLKAVLLTHQHYDHVRDVLALAMNLYLSDNAVDVYSALPARDVLGSHFFDGDLFPNFLETPQENPVVKYTVIEPLQAFQVGGYSVTAVPVNHSVPTVGYQVTAPDGKSVFYTSDTGPGLGDCWKQVSPQLLVTELTVPDSFKEFCQRSGHLCPGLLKQELLTFRELKGYLPQVVTVHMSPFLEEEIKAEIAVVAEDLNTPITLGYEGMEIDL